MLMVLARPIHTHFHVLDLQCDYAVMAINYCLCVYVSVCVCLCLCLCLWLCVCNFVFKPMYKYVCFCVCVHMCQMVNPLMVAL